MVTKKEIINIIQREHEAGTNEYERAAIEILKLIDHEHNYQIARKDYFKPDGKSNILGETYDQTKSFSMLYCIKCGETKEIQTS